MGITRSCFATTYSRSHDTGTDLYARASHDGPAQQCRRVAKGICCFGLSSERLHLLSIATFRGTFNPDSLDALKVMKTDMDDALKDTSTLPCPANDDRPGPARAALCPNVFRSDALELSPEQRRLAELERRGQTRDPSLLHGLARGVGILLRIGSHRSVRRAARPARPGRHPSGAGLGLVALRTPSW